MLVWVQLAKQAKLIKQTLYQVKKVYSATLCVKPNSKISELKKENSRLMPIIKKKQSQANEKKPTKEQAKL